MCVNSMLGIGLGKERLNTIVYNSFNTSSNMKRALCLFYTDPSDLVVGGAKMDLKWSQECCLSVRTLINTLRTPTTSV